MSSNTIYLITGANRGLGKGLAAAYLTRPNNTIIAAVRDVSHPTSLALSNLPTGPSSNLIIVPLDSSSSTAAAVAIDILVSKYSISHIDTLIANAGICEDASPVAKVPLSTLNKHVEVNAYGPLLLFQAALPLLEKSSEAKFVALGSPIGSIGGMESRPFPLAAYGLSKAMLHWTTRKIHEEHPGIVAFVVDPGFVQTDMGNAGAVSVGMKEATTTIADSVEFLTSTIDGATKEKTSGHFPSIEGGDFAW